jgi:hypothetical protein
VIIRINEATRRASAGAAGEYRRLQNAFFLLSCIPYNKEARKPGKLRIGDGIENGP